MNPPRWDTRYAHGVRDALTGMVEAGEPGEPAPPPQRRHHVRLVVAIVIALVLVVAASITALVLANRSAPAGGSTSLTVPTDGSYSYDPSGDYAGVIGRLEARRTGDRVCFWVSSTTETGPFGRSPWYLVFPAGYHATAALDLIDDTGAEVAAVGDRVAVFTTTSALGTTPKGCATGTTLGALHVERSAEETPTPAPATMRPASARCAPTSSGIPAGADTGVVDDVDGDHRPDTEWSVLDGGAVVFGITTASGATVSARAEFAGGGERTFVVGHLANDAVVLIPSEGRASELWSFRGCALHQVQGTNPEAPSVGPFFTLASGSGGGDAMCIEGELYSVSYTTAGGDLEDVVGQRVQVSADGSTATISSTKRTIASRLDPAALARYQEVSCGTAPVLRPQQGG